MSNLKERLLVTGGSGLLGQFLIEQWVEKFEILATVNQHPISSPRVRSAICDLTNLSAVRNLIESFHPRYVVHAAALTNVDICESQVRLAHEVNVVATENIVRSLPEQNTRLIYISTDQVFDGRGSFYKETDQVNPINVYGQTKAKAEAVVLNNRNSAVVRTNFYGGTTSQKASFSDWIIRDLKLGKELNMFDDIYFCPISIKALCFNLELLLKSDLVGIFNFVGGERLSKYDFAVRLAKHLKLDQRLINRRQIDQSKFLAKRPHDMSLSIERAKIELTGFKVESVNEGFATLYPMNQVGDQK